MAGAKSGKRRIVRKLAAPAVASGSIPKFVAPLLIPPAMPQAGKRTCKTKGQGKAQTADYYEISMRHWFAGAWPRRQASPHRRPVSRWGVEACREPGECPPPTERRLAAAPSQPCHSASGQHEGDSGGFGHSGEIADAHNRCSTAAVGAVQEPAE